MLANGGVNRLPTWRDSVGGENSQGDASGWATRAGVPSRVPRSPEEAADLIRSLGPDHTVLVDCPPGRLRDQRMAGVGVVLADALLLPSGSGRPELDALGRAIRALDELAERGAALKAGVILNHFRETTRNRVVEEGLCLAKLPLLGRLSERAAFPEAFADGRSLVNLGGAAAFEAKKLWSRIESWPTFRTCTDQYFRNFIADLNRLVYFLHFSGPVRPFLFPKRPGGGESPGGWRPPPPGLHTAPA